eukprot:g730.t1
MNSSHPEYFRPQIPPLKHRNYPPDRYPHVYPMPPPPYHFFNPQYPHPQQQFSQQQFQPFPTYPHQQQQPFPSGNYYNGYHQQQYQGFQQREQRHLMQQPQMQQPPPQQPQQQQQHWGTVPKYYNQQKNYEKISVRNVKSATSVFKCVPCDRQFKTQQSLSLHEKTHQTCQHEGCSFSASSKIVKEHYRKEHTKLPPKMPKQMLDIIPSKYRNTHKMGESPEEIAKWRAARRANWPSKANIAKKLAAKKEAEESGALPESNDNNIKKRKRGCINDDKIPGEDETKQNKKRICRHFQSKKGCKQGDECQFRHEKKPESEKKNPRKKSKKKQQSTKRKSLLEKLLHNDIRAEHSLLLQCTRFFIENDFLTLK